MSNPERMAKLNELAKVSHTIIFKIDKVLMDGNIANKSNKIWFFTNIHSQKLPKLGIIIGNGYKNSGLVGIYSLRLRKRLTIQHKRQ